MPATNILALSMPRKESDSEVNSFPLKLGEKRLKFILLLFITIDYSPFSSFPLHWLDTCQRQFISRAPNLLRTVSFAHPINARAVPWRQRGSCWRSRGSVAAPGPGRVTFFEFPHCQHSVLRWELPDAQGFVVAHGGAHGQEGMSCQAPHLSFHVALEESIPCKRKSCMWGCVIRSNLGLPHFASPRQ